MRAWSSSRRNPTGRKCSRSCWWAEPGWFHAIFESERRHCNLQSDIISKDSAVYSCFSLYTYHIKRHWSAPLKALRKSLHPQRDLPKQGCLCQRFLVAKLVSKRELVTAGLRGQADVSEQPLTIQKPENWTVQHIVFEQQKNMHDVFTNIRSNKRVSKKVLSCCSATFSTGLALLDDVPFSVLACSWQRSSYPVHIGTWLADKKTSTFKFKSQENPFSTSSLQSHQSSYYLVSSPYHK